MQEYCRYLHRGLAKRKLTAMSWSSKKICALFVVYTEVELVCIFSALLTPKIKLEDIFKTLSERAAETSSNKASFLHR